MSDELKRGWYAIIAPDGYLVSVLWMNVRNYQLLDGHKLVSIDDLLRDAVRYRWLLANDNGSLELWEIGLWIDAKIAGEGGE